MQTTHRTIRTLLKQINQQKYVKDRKQRVNNSCMDFLKDNMLTKELA